MKEQEKLRVLIPHWIEHNDEHADDFRRWAKDAGEVADDILAAAALMVKANESLAAALEKLGGPLEYHHHEHHEH
jgi:hypothetical protein